MTSTILIGQNTVVTLSFEVSDSDGHPIDKPKQQRAVMEHNYEWFSQWIWGEKPAGQSE